MVGYSHTKQTYIQWNLSNTVTYGPDMFGLIREVAGIKMTSIKQSYKIINANDRIAKVSVDLMPVITSEFIL